ncbi:hypothetical protein FFLO_02446 [Filobasidium floriforme]|uniref:Uncharacterized protein n=1 Tax=Filobasidium floriforme TaxID=5210 RepID=A0A8K0JN30_9TREE|nr:uncharacterized protein HD553DRAFT_358043 [Filobasidium floriforme]KAG7562164.1 hypothetical protein FFLO_02446 [Filobasidium floriforme]KAH8082730.1 hypothetical protein HD553DRAFT_358043 [Filobasidium floriforme]
MSTPATPATSHCSNAFKAEDDSLGIRDLELCEPVKNYSLQAGFNTPEQMKISVTGAMNNLHKFTQGETKLKIAGMVFQTMSKGYVLLEGHDCDKNYANLQRPLLGKFKRFDNFLPDHWQIDFVVKFKKATDKKATEVAEKIGGDAQRCDLKHKGRTLMLQISAARFNLDDTFKSHLFTIENEITRIIPANAPKKLIGQYTKEEILGMKREQSKNSHVADLPESKKLPPSISFSPSLPPRISFAPSELQRYIRPKPSLLLPLSQEVFVPLHGMPSYPGPSSITAPLKLASSPTPDTAVEVNKDIKKLLKASPLKPSKPSKPPINRQIVIQMLDDDIDALEVEKEANC